MILLENLDLESGPFVYTQIIGVFSESTDAQLDEMIDVVIEQNRQSLRTQVFNARSAQRESIATILKANTRT